MKDSIAKLHHLHEPLMTPGQRKRRSKAAEAANERTVQETNEGHYELNLLKRGVRGCEGRESGTVLELGGLIRSLGSR